MPRARYRWIAQVYDLVSGEPVYRVGRRRGIELLHLQPGQRVLDLGCGTGLNFAGLQQRVGPRGRIVGVDASGAMLARARRRARRAGWDNVELLEADATHLDVDRVRHLAGGAVDAALATYALSLMPDWRSAWQGMVAATAPGGRLAVVDMQRPDSAPVFTPLARLACALGGADIDAHPWTAVADDCTEVDQASAWAGHLQIRAGTRRAGSISDEGHPWDADPADWVRRQRRADRRRAG